MTSDPYGGGQTAKRSGGGKVVSYPRALTGAAPST
ncbi:hypothetical protein BH10PSE4_BH10PSE4_33070 [soil metagenome]